MGRTKPNLIAVLSGPNASASLPFGTGKMRIGGGDNDDVILAGVPSGLLIARAKGDWLEVAARAGSIKLYHEGQDTPQIIEKGSARARVAMPATIDLNDETTIFFSRRVPSKQHRGAKTGFIAASIALAVGIWVGALFAPHLGAIVVGEAEAAFFEQRKPSPKFEQKAHSTTDPTACDHGCVAEIADKFRKSLKAGGLGGLKLDSSDGIIRVSGAVDKDQLSLWHQIRSEFESVHGRSLPLIASIRADGVSPDLAIASVWLGQAPEVRTKSGAVYRVGDEISENWRIDHIAQGSIHLERSGQRLVLNY